MKLRIRRSGLTLLELIVVLTVVVAITGIIISIMPNMAHKANIVSCTANISELDKSIQTYEATYSEIPNKYDNLVTSGTGGGIPSYVLTGTEGGPSFVAGTLTAAEALSFNDNGLTQLAAIVDPTDGDWKPTFWPYGNSQLTPPTFLYVAANLPVAVLTKTSADYLGMPTGANGIPSADTTTGNYKYVVFGINKPCTLFRNMASEPPYHFADTKAEDPATFYMAFGAVYMVTRDFDGTPKTLSRAKFIGSFAFHDYGLSTAGSHTKEWWDLLKEERPSK